MTTNRNPTTKRTRTRSRTLPSEKWWRVSSLHNEQRQCRAPQQKSICDYFSCAAAAVNTTTMFSEIPAASQPTEITTADLLITATTPGGTTDATCTQNSPMDDVHALPSSSSSPLPTAPSTSSPSLQPFAATDTTLTVVSNATRTGITTTTTTNNNNNQTPPTTRSKKLQQLYLDLGQRDFGKRLLCPLCGMMIVQGVDEDEKQHTTICDDYRWGVSWENLPTAHRPGKGGSGTFHAGIDSTTPGNAGANTNTTRILAIVPVVKERNHQDKLPSPTGGILLRQAMLSPHPHPAATATVDTTTTNTCIIKIRVDRSDLERENSQNRLVNKLQRIQSIVQQELDFCDDNQRNTAVPRTWYLYCQRKRILGVLVVESLTRAVRWNANDASHDSTRSEDLHLLASAGTQSVHNEVPAMMGIYQIWTHAQHRNQGIASMLLTQARQSFVYGCHNIPIARIAFSSPTTEGLRWAQSYCGTPHILRYDARIFGQPRVNQYISGVVME